MSLRIALMMTFLLGSFPGTGQQLFWIATDSSNWDNGLNWSTTSGGSPCGCTPTTTTTVNFDGGPDGTRDGVCGIDLSSVSIRSFMFYDNYDGRLSLNGKDVFTTTHSTFSNAQLIDYIGTSHLQFTGGGFTANTNTTIRVKSIRITNGTTGAAISASTVVATESIRMTIDQVSFVVSDLSVITTPILDITTVNLFLNGATFNGTTHSFTKKIGGLANNTSLGGNLFNAALTKITTLGTSSDLFLANSSPDDFNGNVHFGCSQNNSTIAVAYNANTTISGNLTTSNGQQTAADGITFGVGNGFLIFDGTTDQTFSINNDTYTSANNTRPPTFGNVRIAKSAGSFFIHPISPSSTRPLMKITRVFDFQSGYVDNSASTDVLLQFEDGALATNASNVSFVKGRVYKLGDDAFTFPTGANGFYRPVSISAPSASSTFYAEYVRGNPGNTSNADGNIKTISSEEYWRIDRTSGSGDVQLRLTWNEDMLTNGSTYVQDPTTMVVAYSTGTIWHNLLGTDITGDATQGSVQSQLVALFTGDKKFTLGSTTFGNPLPVTLVSFIAHRTTEGVALQWTVAAEVNNHYYLIEHSKDGLVFESLEEIAGQGTTATSHHYSYVHESYTSGLNYYRLRQVDIDAVSTTLGLCAVNIRDEDNVLRLWPTYASRHTPIHFSIKCSGVVFDASANPVMKFTDVPGIDVSGLHSGVYIIRSNSGQTARFVISH